jgi:hypothetical protein
VRVCSTCELSRVAVVVVTPRLTPVVSAIARQVEFWQELSKEHPNLRRLEDLGGDIASSIQLADYCYEDILRLSPHSLPAIRAYAKFLLEARVWMGGRACVRC